MTILSFSTLTVELNSYYLHRSGFYRLILIIVAVFEVTRSIVIMLWVLAKKRVWEPVWFISSMNTYRQHFCRSALLSRNKNYFLLCPPSSLPSPSSSPQAFPSFLPVSGNFPPPKRIFALPHSLRVQSDIQMLRKTKTPASPHFPLSVPPSSFLSNTHTHTQVSTYTRKHTTHTKSVSPLLYIRRQIRTAYVQPERTSCIFLVRIPRVSSSGRQQAYLRCGLPDELGQRPAHLSPVCPRSPPPPLDKWPIGSVQCRVCACCVCVKPCWRNNHQ